MDHLLYNWLSYRLHYWIGGKTDHNSFAFANSIGCINGEKPPLSLILQLILAERDKQALYDEVKTRHEDILKIESSIKELNSLFIELGTLIQGQVSLLYYIQELACNLAWQWLSQESENVLLVRLVCRSSVCVLFLVSSWPEPNLEEEARMRQIPFHPKTLPPCLAKGTMVLPHSAHGIDSFFVFLVLTVKYFTAENVRCYQSWRWLR